MIVTAFECSATSHNMCWKCKRPLQDGDTVGMDHRYNTFCLDCTVEMQAEEQFEREVINEVEEPETE